MDKVAPQLALPDARKNTGQGSIAVLSRRDLTVWRPVRSRSRNTLSFHPAACALRTLSSPSACRPLIFTARHETIGNLRGDLADKRVLIRLAPDPQTNRGSGKATRLKSASYTRGVLRARLHGDYAMQALRGWQAASGHSDVLRAARPRRPLRTNCWRPAAFLLCHRTVTQVRHCCDAATVQVYSRSIRKM
jgi:hypothetical protein